jgi:hypothetical protein
MLKLFVVRRYEWLLECGLDADESRVELRAGALEHRNDGDRDAGGNRPHSMEVAARSSCGKRNTIVILVAFEAW